MPFLPPLSRRRFLALSGATVAHGLAAQKGNAPLPPPTTITGGIQPLLEGTTARPRRYTPVDGEFVIRNGAEFFNRPIYGPISDFRVDAGDRPEFSLYLPGHGGNLKLGLIAPAASKWLAETQNVVARYRPGRMIYEVRDSMLGAAGVLRVELLTAATGSGVLVRIDGTKVPAGISLAWAFAGASGHKGSRNGDIGCESEPVSRFFQVRPEECEGNEYSIAKGVENAACHLAGKSIELAFTFPAGSQLRVEDYAAWLQPPTGVAGAKPKFPILSGKVELTHEPQFITIRRIKPGDPTTEPDPAREFAARSEQIAAIAASLVFTTPDPYLNAAAPALCIVAEALWDPRQGCVMHGAVAWRSALAGWRGPYVLDALGEHERAKTHLRRWLNRQNVSPVTGSDPATGPADPKYRLARKENLLHTDGDLSNNHYDMNLVFFDVLLRHLRWTGDVEFVREIWPAFKRQLAWEHRLFRRTFTTAEETLPLYEAYAAIWASDNLQYNGGGVAHSSAYNAFAWRFAAELARLLNEDPTPYEAEAALIHKAMQQLLWLPAQGAFAESKDILGKQMVYNNPALWTVYHTIDSEVPTPQQAWQMAAERLAVQRRIPVQGEGIPAGPWFLLACSNWLPYLWSLTLLALGENMHMALALWQTGMNEDAYALLKGNLLDSMYRGLCPGDFHMSSPLDVHRQEAQRDFGDPTGITARALVEGLFGVRPNFIANVIVLRPGFPAEWNEAALRHKDFDLKWHRDGMSETYEFTSRFPQTAALHMTLPARTTTVPAAYESGKPVACEFDPEAVGAPKLTLHLPPARAYTLKLTWRGVSPTPIPARQTLRPGQAIVLPAGLSLRPEEMQPGFHTRFAEMHEADCRWSLPISVEVLPAAPAFLAIPAARKGATHEPLDLTTLLTSQLPDIFSRGYNEPRSPFCSLAIPDTLLGGWANIGAPPPIDDSGLRGSGGLLRTGIGVPFRTPAGRAPNCVFLSQFKPDAATLHIPLEGRAHGVYLLMTGTTLPQCSRMEHGTATVRYSDSTTATLSLRNPETWWPIEQDYLLDDYVFVNDAPLPPRVDLATGSTRLLDPQSFEGTGRNVPGGAATILHLPLDPTRTLQQLELEVSLYGIVAALLAVTLDRA